MSIDIIAGLDTLSTFAIAREELPTTLSLKGINQRNEGLRLVEEVGEGHGGHALAVLHNVLCREHAAGRGRCGCFPNARRRWERRAYPHRSESSLLSLHEVFSTLGSQEVLTCLFGSALKPMAGIACEEGLKALVAAAMAGCVGRE